MAVERISPSSNDNVELLFHWHRYYVAASLSKGKRVLDIACGTGYGADILAKTAEHVVAVDADEPTIREASESYGRSNLHFCVGDVADIPCPSSCFDLVVSFETIEHVSPANQKEFVKEVARVLKDDGVFLVSTPDRHRTQQSGYTNPFHVQELYTSELQELLRERFSFVELYYQEVNLASFIWSASRNRDTYAVHRVGFSDIEGPTATEDQIQSHMYVVAVCSNKPIDVTLDSTAFDVYRKPALALWNEIDTLLTKLKIESSLNESLREELTKMRSDLDESSTRLAMSRRELEVATIRAKTLEEELTRDRERLRNLIRYHRDLERRAETLTSSLQQLENEYHNCIKELNSIYRMRTWKLVSAYRFLMDNTLIGRPLRFVRDIIIGK